MRTVSGVYRRVLVGFLSVALATPFPAWSGSASLGTARGVRGVELSLDEGRSWLPLGTRSLPLLDGTRLRTTTGSAFLDFTDGSRINVFPFSAVSIQETEDATKISLPYGRLTFQLPEKTRVEIATPRARFEPVRRGVMVGEVFVGGAGLAGLKMTQGALRVEEIAGSKRVMLASLEPVFLPKRPAASGPFFTSDPPVTPSPGAKGVFAPSGQSIGYLEAGGQLVIEPGFTANLTRPFPPRLIRLAMASIPENDLANDALPLFDVNGGYVGYLAGPVFYAQAARAAPPAAEGEESAWPWWVGAAVGVAAVGVGIAAAAGAFSGGGGAPPAASPVSR